MIYRNLLGKNNYSVTLFVDSYFSSVCKNNINDYKFIVMYVVSVLYYEHSKYSIDGRTQVMEFI